MKVLVTGSVGFIGQHLLKARGAAGHEPVGLDIRPHSATGCEALRCDLLDAQQTQDALHRTQPDAVVHLAARTDLAERENIEGYAANHHGTAHLIEAMANAPSVRWAGNGTVTDWEWDCVYLGLDWYSIFSRSKTNVCKNLNSYGKRRR